MNRIYTWNHDVSFVRMSRLTYKQIKELLVGEHVYYINTNDEVIGVIYDAKIISKGPYVITMECTPVKETVGYWGLIDVDTKHIESFAYIDALNIDSC